MMKRKMIIAKVNYSDNVFEGIINLFGGMFTRHQKSNIKPISKQIRHRKIFTIDDVWNDIGGFIQFGMNEEDRRKKSDE